MKRSRNISLKVLPGEFLKYQSGDASLPAGLIFQERSPLTVRSLAKPSAAWLPRLSDEAFPKYQSESAAGGVPEISVWRCKSAGWTDISRTLAFGCMH